ncbi:MAG: SDR family NAD(P)-dependent oxidoreductase [Actinobacteria bacterium]|nr:SDR family NAD(P)-dependent oxidoreductase [Actinomycetota bacterium]
MPWTTSDIPDLTGRVAVVTGANSGVGLASAEALAGAGAHVVMAVRDVASGTRARDGMGAASAEVVALDLASLSSVASAADDLTRRFPEIDILLNNAGLMATPERRTEDGFEMQLGVNHFGHWALTAGLLPSLLAADAARVVTVTSMARLQGKPVDPDDVNLDRGYDPWAAYGRSKLANYVFAIGLQQEFERAGAAAGSLAAHPGLSHTNLQVRTAAEGGAGRSAGFWEWAAARFGMEPDRGALPQVRAATDPGARGGELYGPRYVAVGPPVRRPVLRRGLGEAIATLFGVSERETGVPIDLRKSA